MEVPTYTIIEVYAEYIYFVPVGEKVDIIEFADNMNKSNKDSSIKYIITRMDVPISICCDKLQRDVKKHVEIAESVESTQSYVLAQEFMKKLYAVLVLEDVGNKYVLSFPKIDLKDEDDPEELIFQWIKKRTHKIPKGVKKSVRPVTLVGPEETILVYVAKLRPKISKAKIVTSKKINKYR